MSLTVKSNGNGIPVMEEGTYQAICTGIIDIGLQYSEKYKKANPKVMIMWSFPSEKILVNEEEVVRIQSKEYTSSLGEQSNLRRDLSAWRGKQFTDEELQGFVLTNILNVPCLMQIIHKERNGNKYAEISSIMALPKTMEKADASNLNHIIFDFDDKETWGNFFNIPEWIQNKIKSANNYESSGLKAYIETNDIKSEYATNSDYDTKDDLPF